VESELSPSLTELPGHFPAAELLVLAATGVALAGCVWVGWVLVKRLQRGEALVPLRPHEPVVWGGNDVATVLFLLLAAQLVAVAVMPGATPPQTAPLSARLAASVVASLLGTLFAIWHLLSRGAPRESLGFGLTTFGADARLAVATLALVTGPLLIVAGLLDRLVPYKHPVIDLLASQRDGYSLWLVVLSAVVVAPIAEEFLFRRVLQGWLEKRLPEADGMWAIAISSLVFGLAHFGQGLGWLPLVVLGAVLGYLARQTGSIVPGILLHALFNSVSVVLLLVQMAGVPAG